MTQPARIQTGTVPWHDALGDFLVGFFALAIIAALWWLL